jgi:molecular chaperone DnaJ
VQVTLLDGSEHELAVPAGTQPGQVLSVPGKGAPRLDGRGPGTLHVLVQVAVPKQLSKRARKLLQELRAALEPVAPAEAVPAEEAPKRES